LQGSTPPAPTLQDKINRLVPQHPDLALVVDVMQEQFQQQLQLQQKQYQQQQRRSSVSSSIWSFAQTFLFYALGVVTPALLAVWHVF
jgi:hypothetical protein